MGNLAVRGGWRGATLALESQSVGRIFLDNTESKDASIGPRTVLHLNGGYRFPVGGGTTVALSLRVFNLLNRRYATSGYMDYDAQGNLVPQFIPAATRHWLGELRLEF
jgi:outer membrane receptor protein involved in Fe transport